MKILHYIPEQKEDDLVSSVVETLAKAQSASAKVCIATEKTVKTLTASTLFDIVHIHTCWNYNTAQFLSRMADQGFAIVLSPHGGLEDYTMRHEQQLSKQGKRLLYQQSAVERAEGLIVSSNREMKSVLNLGWNHRISVVKSSLFDSATTPEKMANESIHFYQKVIDSRYRRMMTEPEKSVICKLLRLGMAKDFYEQQINPEENLQISSLSSEQWKRILLYADDEGVRTIINKAIIRHHFHIPDIHTESIDRFEPALPKITEPLSIKLNKGKEQRLLSEEQPVLRELCTMLLRAKEQLKKGTLSMNHACMIFNAFRYGDYDEDRFNELISELKIKMFTIGILSVLANLFALSEGFLPIATKENTTSKTIRELLL